MSYDQTLARVETYFDRTATRAWEALTSDAPVSKIRQTVREGRDAMRAQMLARLPDDLRGARILDAGWRAGPMWWRWTSPPRLSKSHKNGLIPAFKGMFPFTPAICWRKTSDASIMS